MRLKVVAFAVLVPACIVGDPTQDPPDVDPEVDAGTSPDPDPDPVPAACGLAASIPDAGTIAPATAERRNQPGSMGAAKYHVAYATLPGSTDRVQIELWDGLGAFAGGVARAGTFPLTGAELSYDTCGVCVRAIAEHGTPSAQEFLAKAGSVTVTAIGAPGSPLTVSVTGVDFGQVDATTMLPMATGCQASLAGAAMSATITDIAGGGGGGGGAGGGGGGGA
ncbi:MAG TPA: hypothetical protein VM734_36360 [Kofleriaceae bacterium]|nr:hypothetical protein [Kofleriaceae bacterium]